MKRFVVDAILRSVGYNGDVPGGLTVTFVTSGPPQEPTGMSPAMVAAEIGRGMLARCVKITIELSGKKRTVTIDGSSLDPKQDDIEVVVG